MKIPLILLFVSSVLSAIGFYQPAWSDIVLISVPIAIASLLALVFVWGRKSAPHKPQGSRRPRTKRPRKTRTRPTNRNAKWVIIDGSNVMHWMGGEPSLKPVKDVLALLKKQGFTAGVMFDANAGYLLGDRYQHDDAFSKQLRIPEDRIMVVPKGTPADPYILTAAEDFNAKIVTNDRFRDWVEQFPQVRENGFLITGWYRDGKLHTSLL
ncbi:hypothetical protein [Planktotalea sp.]|uniref:NYN domain-containing protein n=1 Tax=Planktotalea sp. TaxID=2029877 RepID=UPI003299E6E8